MIQSTENCLKDVMGNGRLIRNNHYEKKIGSVM
jgi:hypothetical protein